MLVGKGKTELFGKSTSSARPVCQTEETFVTVAVLSHYTKYLGATGWADANGNRRVPTPQEVVALGFEPVAYLDQFKLCDNSCLKKSILSLGWPSR